MNTKNTNFTDFLFIAAQAYLTALIHSAFGTFLAGLFVFITPLACYLPPFLESFLEKLRNVNTVLAKT